MKCSKCSKEFRAEDFYRDRRNKSGFSYKCKECTNKYLKEYYKNNRPKILKRAKTYWDANKDVINSNNKNYYQRHRLHLISQSKERSEEIKRTVYTHYGSYCRCCGENNIVFLTIDHINGGGTKHRRSVGTGVAFYSWVVKHNFPDDLQILCYNCNMGKERNNGTCPHEQNREFLL